MAMDAVASWQPPAALAPGWMRCRRHPSLRSPPAVQRSAACRLNRPAAWRIRALLSPPPGPGGLAGVDGHYTIPSPHWLLLPGRVSSSTGLRVPQGVEHRPAHISDKLLPRSGDV